MHHEDLSLVVNRRTFLRTGALGAAAAVSGVSFAQNAPSTLPDGAYRTLGRTGMKISTVSIGALKTNEEGVFQAAFDMGVNYVDTARIYMEGRNEHIVAGALKGYRDKVFVGTKVCDAPKEEMRLSIEQSLEALKVEYVDLLYLHKAKSKDTVTSPEYREVMAQAKNEGKTRFIGVSTHENEVEVVNAIIEDPEKLYDVIMVPYNFKSGPEIKEAIARAAKAGIGVVAMKTQAGGYQTKELGDVSPHQAALKWVLQDKNITTTVPSMVDLNMLKENLAVMGMMQVTQADREILSRYAEAIAPYYCHRCGKCAGTCPKGVDIPEVNRCMMYAEGYRDLALARSTLSQLSSKGMLPACTECDVCTARCVHRIDLPRRMENAVNTLLT